jgi:putative cell wall-binding protein
MKESGMRIGVLRLVTAALTVAVLALQGLQPGLPASAADGEGTISGTVYVWNGSSYAPAGTAAFVRAWSLHSDGPDYTPGTYASTASDGSYSLTLPVGTYRISVILTSNFPQYNAFFSFYAGDTVLESQADVVTISGGEVFSGYDLSTPQGTSMSGTVTFSDGITQAEVVAVLFDSSTGEFDFSMRTTTNPDGTYVLKGLVPGSYLLRFADVYNDAETSVEYWEGEMYIADASLVTVGTDPLSGFDGAVGSGGYYVARISGADRFEAAANVSLGFANDAPVPAVFIVNGLNYPDALSAGAAAAKLGGPVLLVTPGAIPEIVKAALTILQPAAIHIVGGPNSVSTAVAAELGTYAAVTRHGGADRYEASRNLALAMFGDGVRTVYLADGRNFPDALSAGPAAANQYGPVVLVNGGMSAIDSATSSLIQTLGATRVIIAGGPNSVSEGIRHSLADVPGVAEVYRRWGQDRYTAAVDISQGSFGVADAVFLAVGTKFPDALAGGALAGYWRAPLMLSRPDCIPPEVAQMILALKPREIYILGGPASLAPSVENLVVCSV